MSKCDKCGYDDNGIGDSAHVCGPVAVRTNSLSDIKFGGCPFCGSQTCIAGQCRLEKPTMPLSIGGSGLPPDVHKDLADFIASLDKRYDFKHGATAAFWNMAFTLAQHIGAKK